tara:strand:- start:9552 stop:10829 length:1278 start_codon:yes stop_codon:yes gene_type:complete
MTASVHPNAFVELYLDDVPAPQRLQHAWATGSSVESGACNVHFKCPIVEHHNAGRRIELAVFTDLADPSLPVVMTDAAALNGDLSTARSLTDVATRLGIRPVSILEPWPLTSVRIPKPWGEEIWLTGIEERGVSHVKDTPLHWLLDVAGDFFDTTSRLPILLKILSPSPDNPKGDLYFELHEQKQEVYVVTDVNPMAWPDGIGQIRMGFSKQKRASFEDDSAFLSSFREAIADYERVRRQIDRGATSPTLEAEEQDLRAITETYTDSKSLRVGDVVGVPTRVPHSLRHGVRVVEFQTPHYERKIISFAQEVITQEHWDTRDALEIARTDVPETEIKLLSDTGGLRSELVCRFEEFEVRRYIFRPGVHTTLSSTRYQLAMAITPGIRIDGSSLRPEDAVALPGKVTCVALNDSESQAMLLVALPAR